MDRSPAFGSAMRNLSRTFRTRFRFGSGRKALNLATHNNSPGHYAKGTPSPLSLAGIGLRLLVGTRFQVLFHSPHRGSFHFSLTLLCALSVVHEYLALGGGPPRFTPGST